MGLSSPGIGSNLDVNGIVTQLMSIEQQPLKTLATKEASYQAKLSAIGSLKGALSGFQTAVRSLSDVGKFQALNVTAVDKSVLTATGSSGATPGSYAIEIGKLAQAQKLVSAGQASSTDAIGNGTVTFEFGTIALGAGTFDAASGKYTGAGFTSNGAGAKTLTINATNNSLSGIRDAINGASMGVTASIVNDGGTSPYRLVLTEASSGKTSSVKISVTGDPALQALLNHDPGKPPANQAFSETVTAQNAEFKVDGIAISKPTNTVTDVIAGVTLNLAKTNSGSPTNVTVSRDSSAVIGSVGQFVFAYNQINKTLNDLSSYNASTKQAAVLNGDATVRSIQSQIRGVFSNPVAGGASAFNVLSQVGVTLQKDGTMAVDNTKLQAAIDNNFSDIAGLFAAVGKASDSLVTYTGATDKTAPGAYTVNVSNLATQGNMRGNEPAGLAIDDTNNTLQVQLDGVTATITLANATYANAAALATEVQSKINGASAFAGSSVTVTESGGTLAFTSASYGSKSGINITGGSGISNLLGSGQTATQGIDVAGTIGGVAAVGSGQFLTGAAGTAAEGLKIKPAATGDRGKVNFSKGYAYQFDKIISSLLDPTGPISARTDGLNATLKSISTQKQGINDRLASIESRYRAQFTALDTAISSMKKTSDFLTQQLANLPKNS